MTMGHHQQTATILPFPGRAHKLDKVGFGALSGFGVKSGGEAPAARIARASFSDSSYHQAAIDEAPHARKP